MGGISAQMHFAVAEVFCDSAADGDTFGIGVCYGV